VNKNSYILVFFILLMSVWAQAQPDSLEIKLPKDTVPGLHEKATLVSQVKQVTDSLNKKKVFRPDPLKVLWMGAIIPGYGQILNKKYWKLPLVYGGFLGCAYAISWNSGQYQTYKTAYLDILRYASDNSYKAIVDKNPSAVSFYQVLPKGEKIEDFGGISGLTTTLQTIYNNTRRYRDLSIIATVAYYALTLVDAYVDAQLYDFDISPNLSMHVQPALLDKSYGLNNSLGLQCNISLK